MNVAVIGASNKPQRYSYQAVQLLREKGHTVFPVHQRISEVEGLSVFKTIRDISSPINTVSLYISKDISNQLKDDILGAHPQRIIFNPGAENPDLEQEARQRNIQVLNACTLVMLRTGQFG